MPAISFSLGFKRIKDGLLNVLLLIATLLSLHHNDDPISLYQPSSEASLIYVLDFLFIRLFTYFQQ
jgi:hypothetical protein